MIHCFSGPMVKVDCSDSGREVLENSQLPVTGLAFEGWNWTRERSKKARWSKSTCITTAEFCLSSTHFMDDLWRGKPVGCRKMCALRKPENLSFTRAHSILAALLLRPIHVATERWHASGKKTIQPLRAGLNGINESKLQIKYRIDWVVYKLFMSINVTWMKWFLICRRLVYAWKASLDELIHVSLNNKFFHTTLHMTHCIFPTLRTEFGSDTDKGEMIANKVVH